jgi:hypothetical protein
MKNHIFKIFCLLFLSVNIIAQNTFYDGFLKPSNEFRPVPFWHLNGKLTQVEIRKQLIATQKSGFGGVTVLPVTGGPQHPTKIPCPGMSPKFLTDEYFERYLDILNISDSLGMQVILYDDIDFPSGMAGGKMKKLYPNDTRKLINKLDTVVNGPLNLSVDCPSGKFMGAVALNTNTNLRTAIDKFCTGNILQWNVPKGSWKISIFTCSTFDDKVVDYMDMEAVSNYMPLTFGQYEKHFKPFFGKTIKQVFFDDVGYVTKERGWTNSMNESFKKKYKKNPSLYYRALWEDIGSESAAARIAFFDMRAELLSNGYPKMVADWATKFGMKSSGHPPGNYKVQPTDMSFDIFKFYKYSQIPTLDNIFYRGHGREGFKLVSSAADMYDRPVVAAEVYGAFFEDKFDTTVLYKAAMDLFVRGVNFLIPHGMWYDYRPEAVRIPPLISAYSTKVGAELPAYNDFAARCSYMLQGGKRVSDIAVFYPITSLQGHFTFNSGRERGKNVPAGTDYIEIGNMLTQYMHCDFTFLHPEFWVSQQCKLTNDKIELQNKDNSQTYKLLILPGGKVISLAALKKIKSYYDNGGKIIATSVLPSQSAEFGKDAEVVRIVKQLFAIDPTQPLKEKTYNIKGNANGGKLVFVPKPTASILSDIMAKMDVSADVCFDTNFEKYSDNGEISYIHKIKNGKNIYFFVNSTNSNYTSKINLRGKLDVECWNPQTGEKLAISNITYNTINKQDYTQFKLEMPATSSVFIVEK